MISKIKVHGDHLQVEAGMEMVVLEERPTPPNVDEIIKNLQSKINRFFPVVELATNQYFLHL